MFDVLVYLYETYYRPDACPEPAALVKKLSAIGFEEDEISKALGWLTDLEVSTANRFLFRYPYLRPAGNGCAWYGRGRLYPIP